MVIPIAIPLDLNLISLRRPSPADSTKIQIPADRTATVATDLVFDHESSADAWEYGYERVSQTRNNDTCIILRINLP